MIFCYKIHTVQLKFRQKFHLTLPFAKLEFPGASEHSAFAGDTPRGPSRGPLKTNTFCGFQIKKSKIQYKPANITAILSIINLTRLFLSENCPIGATGATRANPLNRSYSATPSETKLKCAKSVINDF